jgi:nucleotide-binding universal stress UspA family protein
MQAIKEKLDGWETEAIPAIEVKQLIMGLEMGGADEALLQYLNFLSEIIPVKAGFFLHVVPAFDLLTPMFRKDVMPLSGVNILKETLMNRMGGEISRLLTSGRIKQVKYKVNEGSPLEELLRESEALNPDLVVIGQKRFANSHGILAKNLARKVTSNALVIPEQSRRSLKTILVPIDFSAYSARAIKAAVSINKRLEEPARILALNVYEMPNISAYMMSKTETEFREMVEEDRMAAFEAFIATHLSEGDENIEQQLVEKDRPGIAHYIMDYAKEQDVDFIVMGARGHSNVELLLLGSVTENVLAGNKHIPTLVVK